MKADSTTASIVILAAIVVLGALSLLGLPGNDGVMVPLGLLVGFAVAAVTVARTIDGMNGRSIAAAVVAALVAALAISFAIGSELRTADVGGIKPGLLTFMHAVSAMIIGAMLRFLWIARKLLR